MIFVSDKRILKGIIVLIVSLLFPGDLGAKRYTVKLATLAPDGSPWHELLVQMGQEWKQVTRGDVVLRIYPDGVAGDERDIIRKIRIGQIHAAAVTINGLTAISQDMNVFAIPLFVDSFEDLDSIRSALHPHLTSELEKNGFILLNWVDVGWTYLFSREPIQTPDDLKELRLFTSAGDYRWAELWRKGGFQPVPLSSLDVLFALQTGLIDAFASPSLVALSLQWFASAPYMLDLKWGPLIGAIIISKKMWDSIPVEYHEALFEIAKETEARAKAIMPQSQQALEVMKANGLKIHHLTQEQKDMWYETTKAFYPHLESTLIPEEILNKAIQIRSQLNSD